MLVYVIALLRQTKVNVHNKHSFPCFHLVPLIKFHHSVLSISLLLGPIINRVESRSFLHHVAAVYYPQRHYMRVLPRVLRVLVGYSDFTSTLPSTLQYPNNGYTGTLEGTQKKIARLKENTFVKKHTKKSHKNDFSFVFSLKESFTLSFGVSWR